MSEVTQQDKLAGWQIANKFGRAYTEEQMTEFAEAIAQALAEARQQERRAVLRALHNFGEEWKQELREALAEGAKEEELPTLGSLWGIAPNATGGLSSEDFVRNQRSPAFATAPMTQSEQDEHDPFKGD